MKKEWKLKTVIEDGPKYLLETIRDLTEILEARQVPTDYNLFHNDYAEEMSDNIEVLLSSDFLHVDICLPKEELKDKYYNEFLLAEKNAKKIMDDAKASLLEELEKYKKAIIEKFVKGDKNE
jgi:predicted transcriptional regulator